MLFSSRCPDTLVFDGTV
uniref:Uncharacterized protein n=1 Tax=Arundo donax TaxID=35708 RepID=A0A0A8Z887_ARUDO